MRIIGVRDKERIEKLMAAKAAMEAAGLEAPPQIEQELGEGYTEKSLEDLRTALLPEEALTPWSEGGDAGYQINMDEIPAGLKILRVSMASPLFASKEKETPVEAADPEPEDEAKSKE